MHTTQTCSAACSYELSNAGASNYRRGEAQVEVRDEVGAQADAGEKERREDVGDDGVDVFRRAFSKMAGFTDGNTGDESAKDRMDSRKFREGSTGKSQRENET